MINSLQWICTKAVRCIRSTLIIISTWLIFCGLTNDMTPATMQNCSAGSVQVWSDPLSAQGLHFLPKTQRWHQKCAFWHCSICPSQPAKGPRCVVPPGVGSEQWPTQMCAATASTLSNEILLPLDRAKYGTMLSSFYMVFNNSSFLLSSDQILKSPETLVLSPQAQELGATGLVQVSVL